MDLIKYYNIFNNICDNPTIPIINNMAQKKVNFSADEFTLMYVQTYDKNGKKIYQIKENIVGNDDNTDIDDSKFTLLFIE